MIATLMLTNYMWLSIAIAALVMVTLMAAYNKAKQATSLAPILYEVEHPEVRR
jgi:hypothetical protein